ncbi:MAG: aminoacyl-tRNA hydrolase [Bacteroidales bacterium]|nr:aminoacyl-tRNA hydrolase [Bacteroidales bacterium]MCL2132824.1 aminoacyl-tRNA hydrolase [Bacteroidales bacterium]
MSFLIVGLGNIGAEYADTRHNIGFSVLEAWVKASNTVFTNVRYGARADLRVKGKTFILIKPSTYMNLSGKAVNYWLQAEKIPIEQLLVIVDDLALPFGVMRMRGQGSDGGHNGLRHINETLGHQNYARLRVGIGNEFSEGEQVDYVLGEWGAEEKKALPALLERVADAAKAFGLQGIDRAMNVYNTNLFLKN